MNDQNHEWIYDRFCQNSVRPAHTCMTQRRSFSSSFPGSKARTIAPRLAAVTTPLVRGAFPVKLHSWGKVASTKWSKSRSCWTKQNVEWHVLCFLIIQQSFWQLQRESRFQIQGTLVELHWIHHISSHLPLLVSNPVPQVDMVNASPKSGSAQEKRVWTVLDGIWLF